jgi:hypothetical protein
MSVEMRAISAAKHALGRACVGQGQQARSGRGEKLRSIALCTKWIFCISSCTEARNEFMHSVITLRIRSICCKEVGCGGTCWSTPQPSSIEYLNMN